MQGSDHHAPKDGKGFTHAVGGKFACTDGMSASRNGDLKLMQLEVMFAKVIRTTQKLRKQPPKIGRRYVK